MSDNRMLETLEMVRSRRLLSLVSLAIVVVLPIILGTYEVRILNSILILAVFGMAFNLAFGFTNLPSFGHAAFYGLGAYGFALSLQWIPGETLAPALICGLLATALFSVIVGKISLRGRGIYFALLTFAFAEFLSVIGFRMTELTGGSEGLIVSVPPVFGIRLNDPIIVYVLSVVILGAVLYGSYRLINSPFGKVMRAIRINPERTEAIGYPVQTIQLLVFTLSAIVSGMAGILYVFNNSFLAPSVLSWHLSVEVLIVTIIGGVATLVGPIVGAIIFVLLEEAVSGLADVGTMFIGAFFILIILFAPDGVVGLYNDLWD